MSKPSAADRLRRGSPITQKSAKAAPAKAAASKRTAAKRAPAKSTKPAKSAAAPAEPAGERPAARQRHVAKPVRVTVDLEPEAYEALRNFAHANRMSHSMVLRELLGMLDDPHVIKRLGQ